MSVRDAAHMAMPGVSVDVFRAANVGDAFGSDDGLCSNDEVFAVGGGGGLCEITASDETTDGSGDVEITALLPASSRVWAWTGDLGDRFKDGDTSSVWLDIAVTKRAAKLRVSDDLASNARAAKFGDRVGFVLEVVDADGEPVAAAEGLSVKVKQATTVSSGAAGAGLSSTASEDTFELAAGETRLELDALSFREGRSPAGVVILRVIGLG